MKLEFLRIQPEDLGRVSSVIQGVSDWWTTQGKPMWPLETLTPEALLNSYPTGEFWLGVVADEAVATFVLVEDDPLFWRDIAPDESLFIHKIAVDRRFAGQGFGVQILDFAMAQAREHDKRFLRLDTDVRRAPVRALYERYGFVWAGELRVRDFDCVLYEIAVQ
jgi:ribosomal protein S18 acetylase RimI-like enzyme